MPEEWELLARSIEDGNPVCYVVRVVNADRERVTIWKLVQYADGWRSVAQWISNGGYRVFPEKRGVKLSDSRIDRILFNYAQGV